MREKRKTRGTSSEEQSTTKIKNHLDGEGDLPLAFEFSENSNHIQFEKPEDVSLDEFIDLVVIVFESLHA